MDENRLDKKQIREIKDKSRLDPKRTNIFIANMGKNKQGGKTIKHTLMEAMREPVCYGVDKLGMEV